MFPSDASGSESFVEVLILSYATTSRQLTDAHGNEILTFLKLISTKQFERSENFLNH